jgi:hypothetical protein
VLNEPVTLVRTAGALQLLQLPLMSLAGKKLGWHAELARLTPVNRLLFSAIGRGIVVYVMGTGLLVIVHADAMTATSLGRSLLALQAVAWCTRLGAQVFGIRQLIPREARAFSRLATSVYASLALSYCALCAWLFLATTG